MVDFALLHIKGELGMFPLKIRRLFELVEIYLKKISDWQSAQMPPSNGHSQRDNSRRYLVLYFIIYAICLVWQTVTKIIILCRKKHII